MRASAAGPQSVDRALDILDAVAHAPGPVTAKALARQLGCSLSMVYNLLGPLTTRGHLTRTARGYVLGPQVPALHRAFQAHRRLHHRLPVAVQAPVVRSRESAVTTSVTSR